MPDKDEKRDFGAEIAKIMPAIIREASKCNKYVASHANLSLTDIIVLDIIREDGPQKMTKLAEVLNLSMSATTSVIDRMIEQDLVTRGRSEDDRRVVNVDLKKKGRDMAEYINNWRKEIVNDMYAVLAPDEKAEYLRLLYKVYYYITKEKTQ